MYKDLVLATSLKIASIEDCNPGYFKDKLDNICEEFGIENRIKALQELCTQVNDGFYDYDKALDSLKYCIDDLISKDIIQPSYIDDTKEMISYFNLMYLPIKDISAVSNESIINRIDDLFDNLALKGKYESFKDYVRNLSLDEWKDVDLLSYGNLSKTLIAHVKICFLGKVCYDIIGGANELELDNEAFLDVIAEELKQVEIKLFCRAIIGG